jgi:excinuclease UvrABC nuclease subunit
MQKAAKELDFVEAAFFRDQMKKLETFKLNLN